MDQILSLPGRNHGPMVSSEVRQWKPGSNEHHLYEQLEVSQMEED